MGLLNINRMTPTKVKSVCASADNMAAENAVAAEKTKVESVELVLPPHTNHQVSVRLTSLSVYPRKPMNRHLFSDVMIFGNCCYFWDYYT